MRDAGPPCPPEQKSLIHCRTNIFRVKYIFVSFLSVPVFPEGNMSSGFFAILSFMILCLSQLHLKKVPESEKTDLKLKKIRCETKKLHLKPLKGYLNLNTFVLQMNKTRPSI